MLYNLAVEMSDLLSTLSFIVGSGFDWISPTTESRPAK